MKNFFYALLISCLVTSASFAQSAVDKTIDVISVSTMVNTVSHMSAAFWGSASGIMQAMNPMPLLAGAGGAATTRIIDEHICNGNTKEEEAARNGAAAGATVGTIGSVGALAFAGAGPAGLATIGSWVGGGMAAGATMVIGAPAILAGATAATCYWLWK